MREPTDDELLVFLARYNDASMGLDALDYTRVPDQLPDLFGSSWERQARAWRAWRQRAARRVRERVAHARSCA